MLCEGKYSDLILQQMKDGGLGSHWCPGTFYITSDVKIPVIAKPLWWKICDDRKNTVAVLWHLGLSWHVLNDSNIYMLLACDIFLVPKSLQIKAWVYVNVL